jgi:peptidoglycan/xylan/chitin deacetylase (PgdA/CDA1 family)
MQSGHEVGNHTFGHILTSHLEFNKGLSDLRKNDILLRESFNIIPKYIRPPFGKITFPILFYALQKSQKIIMWSFDSRDSFLKNDSDLMQGLEKVKSGDILLFHDDTEITSKMLSHIIRRLLKNGFCFGSLNHIA